MKSRLSTLMVTVLIMTQANLAFGYEVRSTKSSSYIMVREPQPDAYEVLYCKQGASECIRLGDKATYSMKELKRLAATEDQKMILTGVGAAAAIFMGAWYGAVGATALGTKHLVGTALNAAVSGGAIGGVIISAEGISMLDRMNPLQHYRAAKMISLVGSSEVNYVNDIDRQAMWLSSRLELLK